MNCADTEFLYSAPGRGLQESAESEICAISEQFSARGLVDCIKRDAREQIAREEKTLSMEPLAYRLSGMNEGYVSARYRHGRDVMGGKGLVEYFFDTRALRTRDADFSVEAPKDDAILCGEAEKECLCAVRCMETVSVYERAVALPGKIARLPRKALQKARDRHSEWFNAEKSDTSRESHRFPLSALAAIFAVAVSLMLIVASSVMIHHAEGRVNTLKRELSNLTGEVAELKSDLCVENDLRLIRKVATEELGMVGEEYVRSEYLSGGAEESIEVFEEERESGIGLSTLLNALGIK